jgi:diguanylate cyclase
MKISTKEAAKEAIRLLGVQQKAPTPENYAELFYNILGEENPFKSLNLSNTTDIKNFSKTIVDLVVKYNGLNEDELKKLKEKNEIIQNSTEEDELRSATNDLLKLSNEIIEANQTNNQSSVINVFIDGINKIVFEDEWINSKIKEVKELFNKQDYPSKSKDLEDLLKLISEKQNAIREELVTSQTKLQNMLAQFMDNLASFSQETDDYHNVIENSAKQIAGANKIEDIHKTLDVVLKETKNIEIKSKAKKEELQTIKNDAEAAQNEIKRLKKELEKSTELIRIDSLTGVLNRKGMNEALEKAEAIMRRTQKSFCVSLIDIDNFKKLNDSLGHHAGDKALIHLAETVKASLRPQDTLARYGGEEFVVILSDTEIENAVNVMARVQRELAKNTFIHEEHKLTITFSCGVAQVKEGMNAQEALIRADQAMYTAKQTGKNRVVGAQ